MSKEAKNWPTPIVGDAHLNSTPEAAARRLEEGKATLSRVVEAKNWSTPLARDHKDATLLNDAETPQSFHLGRQAPRATGQMSLSGYGQRVAGDALRLNPQFVEWLMGFPSGWTSFEPSAMPLSPNKQPSHSETCGDESHND